MSGLAHLLDELEAVGFVAVDARGSGYAHVDSLISTLRREAWRGRGWRLSVRVLNRNRAEIEIKGRTP